MTIEELAVVVMSNFKKLQEGEIIARIMLISNRSYSRAFKGYELMVEKKVLQIDRIEFYGLWKKLHTKNPYFPEFMDRIDGVPGKATQVEYEGFKPPRILTIDEARKMFELPKAEF